MPYYTRVLSKHSEFPSWRSSQLNSEPIIPTSASRSKKASSRRATSRRATRISGIACCSLHPTAPRSRPRAQSRLGGLARTGRDRRVPRRPCRRQARKQRRWLLDYLDEVKTIYAFQHLQGSETVDGSNALHALRTALWERGDAILQADGEGFTNEEGYHIVWQFSDTVSGPWNMAVLQDETGRTSPWTLATPTIERHS